MAGDPPLIIRACGRPGYEFAGELTVGRIARSATGRGVVVSGNSAEPGTGLPIVDSNGYVRCSPLEIAGRLPDSRDRPAVARRPVAADVQTPPFPLGSLRRIDPIVSLYGPAARIYRGPREPGAEIPAAARWLEPALQGGTRRHTPAAGGVCGRLAIAARETRTPRASLSRAASPSSGARRPFDRGQPVRSVGTQPTDVRDDPHPVQVTFDPSRDLHRASSSCISRSLRWRAVARFPPRGSHVRAGARALRRRRPSPSTRPTSHAWPGRIGS
jgi:hypothetical protein